MGQRGCFRLRSSPSVQKRFADMHPVQFRQINTNGHQYSYETQNSSMHACKYTSNVLMLFIYTLKHRWIWYGRHCPQPCLNIRLQQDDLHKPMLPLPCQHTCPAQTQCQMQQIHKSFLRSECRVTQSFLAMRLSITGQQKDIFGLWALWLLRENEAAKRDGFRSHVVVTRMLALKCWRLFCHICRYKTKPTHHPLGQPRKKVLCYRNQLD